MKAIPTVAVASVIVALGVTRGKPLRLSGKILLVLIVNGLLGHIVGNVGFQFSLHAIGLALAVPLTLGSIITCGAVLGRFWLGEAVTSRTVWAMIVLIIAVPILTFGAEKAATAPPTEEIAEAWFVALGVLAALMAGIAYAIQSCVLRLMATSHTPHSVTLLVLSGTGSITLGMLSLERLGWQGLLATSQVDFLTMIGAGLFNAAGFFLLIKALQLVSVVQVNAINASQAAMAAVAGIFFFHERVTVWLVSGVVLTIVGLLLIDRAKQAVAIEEV